MQHGDSHPCCDVEPDRHVQVPLTTLEYSAEHVDTCLLYTSDAADERSSVDLGGRRIIKKKKKRKLSEVAYT